MLKMNNNLREILISLIIFITFKHSLIECEPQVTGRCGRLLVPTESRNSIEPSRFENKEKVTVSCQLWTHDQIECRNGRWIGQQPRCGKHLMAQIIKLDIFDCQISSNKLLVSQGMKQTLEPTIKLNSFNSYYPTHTLQGVEKLKTWVNGSNCYTYQVRFDRKIQIWFLLVEIWTPKTDTNITLSLTAFISKYRTCILHRQTKFTEGTVFKNHFICDLKDGTDIEDEEAEMPDTITFNIKTNSKVGVALIGVYIGDIYTINSSSGTEKPDCGIIQIQNIGVDIQSDDSHNYISCNDSFIDISEGISDFQNIRIPSPNGNPIHKFSCNWNGVWEGKWPVCVPKKACPQQNIYEKDGSVVIEEIGNFYFLNESKWFAINESFIRYSCVHENDIIAGKPIRRCLKNGQWSSNPPYCSRVYSSLEIVGILFVLLVIFFIIVLFVFRIHSKRMKRQLRETRNEMEEVARKRATQEFYDDMHDGNYDNPEQSRKSVQTYDSVDYETFTDPPRYEADPQRNRPSKNSPEYLTMLSTK